MLHTENLVWLMYERVFGWVVGSYGAYVTLIRYTKGGVEFEVLLENDEFKFVEDFIEYE